MKTLFDNMDNLCADFEIPTESPINQDILSKQNQYFLDMLLKGGKYDYTDAYSHGIGTPHSRANEVKAWLKRRGIILHDEMKRVTIQRTGDTVSCKQYWLEKEDILKLKK